MKYNGIVWVATSFEIEIMKDAGMLKCHSTASSYYTVLDTHKPSSGMEYMLREEWKRGEAGSVS